MAANSRQRFIEEELQYVRDNLTGSVDGTEIIACHPALVQVKVK